MVPRIRVSAPSALVLDEQQNLRRYDQFREPMGHAYRRFARVESKFNVND
jgi:hypothetical protein